MAIKLARVVLLSSKAVDQIVGHIQAASQNGEYVIVRGPEHFIAVVDCTLSEVVLRVYSKYRDTRYRGMTVEFSFALADLVAEAIDQHPYEE